MDTSVSTFYSTQPFVDYELSHGPRFDFLIKDLELDKIQNKTVLDFGCGYGSVFHRMPKSSNRYLGVDGALVHGSPYLKEFTFIPVDLDASFAYHFSDQLFGAADIGLCFETLEHLKNPYGFLLEIKKSIVPRGTLYLSIPDEECRHNVIYPGLFNPVENFTIFLRQMAFRIERMVRHDKAFSQWVFTLTNLEWQDCKMQYESYNPVLHGQPPHVIVNS